MRLRKKQKNNPSAVFFYNVSINPCSQKRNCNRIYMVLRWSVEKTGIKKNLYSTNIGQIQILIAFEGMEI